MMMFKDSCVTNLSENTCVEQSTTIPNQIFPVYVGTGRTVMSIDGSGLQGLGHGVERAFGSMPGAGEQYIVSHGMMSDIITPDNVHPYGYLVWSMESGGAEGSVTADNLVQRGSLWKRRSYIDLGWVVTSMVIDANTCLELSVTAPFGENLFIIGVRAKEYDRSGQRKRMQRKVTFTISLNMSTRDRKPTFQSATFDHQTVEASYNGVENYRFCVTAYSSTGNTSFENGQLSVHIPLTITDDWCEASAVFSFNEEKHTTNISELIKQNKETRQTSYGNITKLSGLTTVQSYLYNNTVNLLFSCFEPSMGYPIGSPFYFPWCWRCSTFWDSTFVMDGLMRLGCKSIADRFIEFLYNSMRSDGKPFSWMFAYNGMSTVEDERDIAPLVMCAHAMTAIRHYEYFLDEAFLLKFGLPIIKRVSLFAAENMFSKNEAGKWILSTQVSNDVVDEQAVEINQTFTLVWYLSIMKKCTKYINQFEDTPCEILEEIISNYYIEQDENEYHHSKGIKASEHSCASWVPFLLFPTEGLPFIDRELMRKTRVRYSWEELYRDFQGCFQPWTEFIQAVSDLRREDNNEAYRLFELGVSHTYGPGYFSEVGPMQQTVGLPPYVSACGSYLNYLTSLYIGTDLWDGSLNVFTGLPDKLEGQSFSCEGLICCKGIRADASIDNLRLRVTLQAPQDNEITLSLRLPWALELSDIIVLCGGLPVDFSIVDRRKRIIKLSVNVSNTISVIEIM